MARASEDKLYNTFIAGLITEASEIAFPENASVDEVNYVLKADGSRKRRKGIDYESGYAIGPAVVSTDAIRSYEWRDVSGSSTLNFNVVQLGSTLHFYINGTNLSGNKKSFTYNLLTHKIASATDANVSQNQVDMSSGGGYLFIVGQYIEPFYISYDSGGDSITGTEVVIESRDFDGLDDGLDIDTTPSVLSDNHHYNLTNQGWKDAQISAYYGAKGVYPSNAMTWHYGKIINTGTGVEEFNSNHLSIQAFGNTEAPKGHYIYEVFNRSTPVSSLFFDDLALLSWGYAVGTATITFASNHNIDGGSATVTITGNVFTYDNGGGCGSAVTSSLDGTYTATVVDADTVTIPITITGWIGYCDTPSFGTADGERTSYSITSAQDSRPRVVSFYAGRAWYMGATSAGLSTKIFFSSILTDITRAGKCYQSGDPTSEHLNSVVDTDGGFITIPEIGEIQAAEVVGSSLVLFASNGIWHVSGGDSGFFTATSLSVGNVSDIGIKGRDSLVIASGIPFYWSEQGVFILKKDDISNNITAENVSWARIQTLYDDIPDSNKDYVVGRYNDVTKRIYWLYSDTASYTYKYDKALVFDVRLEAFSKFSIDDTSVHAVGLSTTLQYNDKDYKVKFLTNNGTGLTFSEMNRTDFLDWYTHDSTGVDAAAYLDTGFEILNDPSRKKQAPYCFIYFKRTEQNWILDGADLVTDFPSGCKVRFKWDWANSSTAGRWSREYQAYRIRRPVIPTGVGSYDDGQPVVWTKMKVRGRGHSLHLRFSSEPGKDCHILGWMISYTGGVKQ